MKGLWCPYGLPGLFGRDSVTDILSRLESLPPVYAGYPKPYQYVFPILRCEILVSRLCCVECELMFLQQLRRAWLPTDCVVESILLCAEHSCWGASRVLTCLGVRAVTDESLLYVMGCDTGLNFYSLIVENVRHSSLRLAESRSWRSTSCLQGSELSVTLICVSEVVFHSLDHALLQVHRLSHCLPST